MRSYESVRQSIENGAFQESGQSFNSRLGNRLLKKENNRLRKAGYATYAVPSGDEYELKYIYTGKTYIQSEGRRRMLIIRMIYAFISACVIGLFFSSAWRVPLNSVLYVTLPQAVCIPAFAWLIKCTISGFIAGDKEFSEKEYKSICLGIRRSAVIGAIACCLEMISVIVFIILNHTGILSDEFFCAVKYLLCAVMLFVVYRIEIRVRYEVENNKINIPEEYICMD